MTDEFEWDSGNIPHVRRHGLDVEECEQAVRDPRGIFFPVDQDRGEERLGIIGETEGRRLLAVIITARGGGFRVVTAYPANQQQLRAYQEADR